MNFIINIGITSLTSFEKNVDNDIFHGIRFTGDENNFLVTLKYPRDEMADRRRDRVGIELVWPTWSLQIPLVGIEESTTLLSCLHMRTSRLDRRDTRRRKKMSARKKENGHLRPTIRSKPVVDKNSTDLYNLRLISMEIIFWEKKRNFKNWRNWRNIITLIHLFQMRKKNE